MIIDFLHNKYTLKSLYGMPIGISEFIKEIKNDYYLPVLVEKWFPLEMLYDTLQALWFGPTPLPEHEEASKGALAPLHSQ